MSGENDTVDVFDAWLESRLEQVHTALPGRIETYSGHSTRRATVKPLVTLKTRRGADVEIPAIADVPVVFPGSSAGEVLIELNRGDGCLILFAEEAIGNFLESDVEVDVEDNRRFSLTDAICIPGLWSFRSVPTTPALQRVTIELDSTGMTVRTGDAAQWAPNTLAIDAFTGLPHSTIQRIKGA